MVLGVVLGVVLVAGVVFCIVGCCWCCCGWYCCCCCWVVSYQVTANYLIHVNPCWTSQRELTTVKDDDDNRIGLCFAEDGKNEFLIPDGAQK